VGTEKSIALLMFHALTAVMGRGKKIIWTTWNSFPELTAALLELAYIPAEISELCMHAIERFAMHSYLITRQATSTCIDVNQAKKKLFARISCVKRILPTHAALEQHVKIAIFQGGQTITCLRSHASFSK